MAKKEAVLLLWTGGWDSTFRLLQLLHDTDADVQPLYLVEEGRGSTPREIETMRSIRERIEHRWPETSNRLRATDYGSYRATRMKPRHREQWEALKQRGRVGLQYPILASYANHNDMDRMDLSIERRGGTIQDILEPVVEQRDTPAGPVYALPSSVDGPEALFEHFTFPLLNYTKLDMKGEAKRRGWMPIMKQTQFCFNPTFGRPCGVCHPCRIAKREGLGERVGYVGPLMFWVLHPRMLAGTVIRKLGLR